MTNVYNTQGYIIQN